MLKNLFKKKKKEIPHNEIINKPKENEEKCKIEIIKTNNYSIVTLNKYASPKEFSSNETIDLISNNISWNSTHQKFNYGTYYIIKNNNKIYNILINDKVIKIDERIQFETYSHEKIITFEITNNILDYFQCKHNLHGSSYETLYYNSQLNGFFIKELELNKENTSNEINTILNNLNEYEFINEIFDIEKLFKTLNELLNKKIELTLK